MPDVISTIGASGNYATVQLWHAAIPGTLAAATRYIGEVLPGTVVETVTTSLGNGKSPTDTGCAIILRKHATAAYPGATSGTKATIETSTLAYVCRTNPAHTNSIKYLIAVEDVILHNTGVGTGIEGFRFEASNDTAPFTGRVSRCRVLNDGTGANDHAIEASDSNLTGAACDIIVENSILHAATGDGINVSQGATVKLYNLLCYDNDEGIECSVAGAEVKNCVCVDNSGTDIVNSGGGAVNTTNFTNDGSVGSTAITTADFFDGSYVRDATGLAGTDLGSDYYRDITGAIRTGSWEAGAHEYTNNQPPVVTITLLEYLPRLGGSYTTSAAPHKFLTNDTIRLTGTCIDPEDGNISAGVLWEYSRNGGAYTTIGTGATVTWTAPGVDPYTIRASRTDSGSVSDTDTVDLTISVVIAKVASTAFNASARQPAISGLDSRLSRSATGIINPLWSQVSPGSPTIALSLTTSHQPTFTAPSVTTDTPFTMRVTISDGSGNTNTADVVITAQFSKQSLLYCIKSVETALTSLATTVNHQSLGEIFFTGAKASRSGTPIWGNESGGTVTNTPLATFGSGQGVADVLYLFAFGYSLHLNLDTKRTMIRMADTLRKFQNVSGVKGVFQDIGFDPASGTSSENRTLRSANSTVPPEFSTRDRGYQNMAGNDDSSSQSMANAFLKVAKVLYDAEGAGSVYATYLGYALDYFNEIKNLATYVITSGDIVPVGEQPSAIAYNMSGAVGATPYNTGGVPLAWPLARALRADFSTNWDGPGNETYSPEGVGFTKGKANNDSGTAMYVIFCINLWKFLKQLETAAITPAVSSATVAANLELHCRWFVTTYQTQGGWAPQCGIGLERDPATGLLTTAFKDKPCWGRNTKEPPALTCAEIYVGQALCAYYDHIPAATTGLTNALRTDLLAVLQDYCNKLRPSGGVTTDAGAWRWPDGNYQTRPWRYAVLGTHSAGSAPRIDPNVAAAAATLGTTAAEMITFAISGSFSLGKQGYDKSAGNTLPSASNPAYNIGYCRGTDGQNVACSPTTVDAGQQYHNSDYDRGDIRSPIIDSGTGAIVTANFTGNNVYSLETIHVSQNPPTTWNHSTILTAFSTQDSYGLWDVNTNTYLGLVTEYYNFNDQFLRIWRLLHGFAIAPGSLTDSDADGVLDTADAHDFDPDIVDIPKPSTGGSSRVSVVGSRDRNTVHSVRIGRKAPGATASNPHSNTL